MATYTFKALLTENGWVENAAVQLDAQGNILSISQTASPQGEYINGYALPGFQNAHSHAFQYAMAGLAELHTNTGVQDDFWSWRNAMYGLALTLSPEQMEAVAAMLYSEMARHGYTAVAEFHYLHHDKDGKPYANLAEMGQRLVSAAKRAGIRITLVPMFYQQGGFGQPPVERQKRFISQTIEDYYKLLEATQKVVEKQPHANVGVGIHSLRAVKPEDVISVCNSLDGSMPFHIHVSEQLKEIEDCLAFHNKRPVQWLLDNVKADDNYHLVHATHLDENEANGIAKSGANVVLCPSTEGNLGDGLFSFEAYKNAGGNWSIGTDSHVGLNPLEELRILDYGQRLISHKRTTFVTPQSGDSGFNALKMAWQSGRKAMGAPHVQFFAPGQPFDAAVFKATSPLIATASLRNLSNTLVYSADVSDMLGTVVSGKWVNKEGASINREAIVADFVKVMKELGTRV
ncbi:formiminoglutamase [Flavobacterium akiainvivens]|uniref:Formiminoglutamase n=1 Tax=Flavobacterium akiainvivens TaxID=1202724 RepID=A0A0M8MIK3_9FLAO|nr:formimidoylglutamate deiminase [Flavobacterium akiainvivens]KOS06537.1 formiminoglutamase [Flavobacterium akiainvivens]SFQ11118.1 formimidoylglutamate deiminase [Flavobacterium akiainvivens]